MGMIGCRRTTFRTIIEHQHLGILLQQLMDMSVAGVDLLRLVLHTWDGEVDRQDGEGVHQQVVLIVDVLLHLLLRTVLFTEETGACCHRLLVDAGSCRDDAGGIPLYLHGGGADRQFTGLHVTQFPVAASGIVPFLQLTVEEALQRRIHHQLLTSLQHLLACQDLKRAQLVFIEVVGVDLVDAEGSIAVASPSATQIELCEDTSDAVMAREDQSQRIVLTIRGVGESDLSQQGGEEGTGCPQTIDAQGIVGAVLIGPLCVVDQSRRQGVQIEIAHPVAANHHCRVLLMEGIHHLLQRLG